MKVHPFRTGMYWALLVISRTARFVMYALLLPIMVPCALLALLGEGAAWLNRRTSHLGFHAVEDFLMRVVLPAATWLSDCVDPSGPPEDTEDIP